jgi:hypothetical protein
VNSRRGKNGGRAACRGRIERYAEASDLMADSVMAPCTSGVGRAEPATTG